MERTQLQENKRDLAVLVGLRSPVLREDSTDEESLRELAALVDTAGGRVVGSILQSRESPTPTASSARARWRRSRPWWPRRAPHW